MDKKLDTEFSYKYSDIIGDFEGAEEVANISAIDTEEYEQMTDREKEIIKDRWINASAADLRKEVNIVTDRNSIFELNRKYLRYLKWKESGEIEEEKASGNLIILDPPFQRENVWGLKKKQELIESVLLGIPLPVFYFSEDRYGNLIVVDGKQRLTTFFEFMNEGMDLGEHLKPLVGNKKNATHEDLSSTLQSKFEDFKLSCYIVSSTSSPIIQNEIFLRVNRGGMILNKQEIRNALNQGKSTRLLNDISKNDNIEFVKKNRKKDQYIALRFFAFYLYRTDEKFIDWYLEQVKIQALKTFNVDFLLDFTMKYLNESSEEVIKDLYDLFVTCYQRSMTVFEGLNQAPFSRGDSRVVNMNIFEIWMYLMSKISFSENKDSTVHFLQEKYMDMIKSQEFVDKILYLRDQEERVNYRFSYVENLYKQFIQEK